MIALFITAITIMLVAGLTLFVVTRPETFRIERTVSIAAPPEAVHPLISNFHNWTKWSPFEAQDGDRLQRTFAGPDHGVGAVYGWNGPKAGVGRMEILEAPPERVLIQLDFIKPFKARNSAEFSITPDGSGGSAVTWAMYGPNGLVSRLMSLVFSMEKGLGPVFEQGLADLKKTAETA